MKFAFVAKHRGIWPVRWMCEALGVSRSGFHAWLARPPSKRARTDEETGARVRASFLASDRTYGARRVWRDVLAEGIACGLHKIERLMRAQAGTVGFSVCEAVIRHASTKRSLNTTANCVFASNHSRGGRFQSAAA